MNFLGKICVVLILIMSIVFMSLAMAVYATHRNWKTAADQLRQQVNDAQTKNRELESQLQQLDRELESEKTAYVQQLQKLETERQQLVVERDGMQQRMGELVTQNRELTGTVGATEERLRAILAEVEQLRSGVNTAQQERDKIFASVVEKTEQIHQTHAQLVRANERRDQLVGEVARFKQIAAENNIDPNAPPKGLPPEVLGQVTAVRKNDLIEVSIGSDDGLRAGHTIEVYRGQSYLGRVQILETSPDRAVGRILKQYQKGVIQVDDHVATRLRFS